MALPSNQRTPRCADLRDTHIGQTVTLAGWVNNYREHGGMVFIDLRDRDGVTQLKFNPETDPKAHEVARGLRNEDVIAIRGSVASRGENINPKLPTGTIEVNTHQIDVLNKSKTPPFEIADNIDTNEDLRLKYRFLDLRRPELQKVFRLRHRIVKNLWDFFAAEDLIEM